MAIRGKDFLDSIERLDLESEPDRRTIIGRLYYASFLEARDRAGVTSETAEVHRAVINHWQQREPRAANSLHNLRRCRNEADYDTNLDITEDNVSAAKRHARMLLRLFNIHI